MTKPAPSPRTVLAIGGWDPTGGAGIVADARTIHACGGYALTALTGLAVQTPHKVLQVDPVAPELLAQTLRQAISPLPVHALKTGMLGNAALAEMVFEYIRPLYIPWVFDPVSRATDGTTLGEGPLASAFPRKGFSVITPNLPELKELTGEPDLQAALDVLFERGFDAVLLKGGHGGHGGDGGGAEVEDWLFVHEGQPVRHVRPRLAGTLHGSGCVLASALAASLAKGLPISAAFARAEHFMDSVWMTSWDVGNGVRLSILPSV